MTDFDSLIDAAAREMTDAPSPVDLRARVVAEIHAGGRSPHMWWLGAAAGILLAVYLGWPSRQPAEDARRVVIVDGPGVPPSPVRETVPVAPHRPVTRPRARPAPAPGALEPMVASIPALDVPDAIGIAPLDATSDTFPALGAVEPLDLEQLDIKPLTPPGPAAGGQ